MNIKCDNERPDPVLGSTNHPLGWLLADQFDQAKAVAASEAEAQGVEVAAHHMASTRGCIRLTKLAFRTTQTDQ